MARLNKTRGIDTAEKIEAKQREFWRLFERFVEIKRHAMTKRAAILFELLEVVITGKMRDCMRLCMMGLATSLMGVAMA